MSILDIESLVKQHLGLINELKPLIIKYRLNFLTTNSREATANSIFVALKGLHKDARDFIPEVVKQGTSVVICHAFSNEVAEGRAYSISTQEIDGHSVTIFKVKDLNRFLSFISLKFYDFLASIAHPEEIGLTVPVIGITGTNGKTLTTNLIAQGLKALVNNKHEPYINGTLGLGTYSQIKKGTNTTPDACVVMDNIFQADFNQASAVVMEVSSHGLALNRVRNVRFNQAIFTNLTQDHLDYHGTIEEYFQAKARFFTKHNVKDFIVTCDGSENDYGARLVKLINQRLVTYDGQEGSRGVSAAMPALLALQGAIPSDEHLAGAKNTRPNPLGENEIVETQPEDYDLVSQVLRAKQRSRLAVINIGKQVNELVNFKADIIVTLKEVEAHPQGIDISFSFEDKIQSINQVYTVKSQLVGLFNAYNLLITIVSLYLYGIKMQDILSYVPQLKAVKGRMEVIPNSLNKTIIVDFAHTPDALEKAIESAKVHFNGQVNSKITLVFGCGGDRDKGKRPIMGKIASLAADKVIITDDNPRSENPTQIAEEIFAGVVNTDKVIYIANRAEAIKTAIQQASLGDYILIAGKGHETEQIYGTEINYFSDQETIISYLKSLEANDQPNS